MKTKTVFKFWLENRNDKERKLTLDEITLRYVEWLKTKGRSWIEYYGHQTVAVFIGDKEGLNAVTDEETHTALVKLLKEVRHKYLDSCDVQ